jgi:3',5'-cyclic AMP phosphodiesterase CpdA
LGDGNARRWIAAVSGFVALLVGAAAARAEHDPPDTFGHSTVEQRIVAADGTGFRFLTLDDVGADRVVREDGIGVAQPDRDARRESIAYFGQLSDFQLADEESPARVEFLDLFPGAGSAFRPWEALEAQIDDATIRQMNAFAGASPVPDGDLARRPMDFAINTGDSADSQQRNETTWVRQLLEGEAIDPNSGIDPAGYEHPLCDGQEGIPDAAEAALYTGVQDHGDYNPAAVALFGQGAPLARDYFYSPDDPVGLNAGWPNYPGLMDAAQQSFQPEGLEVPSYLAFGNHDGLVQGSMGASPSLEAVATGCIKVLAFPGDPLNFNFGVQDVLELRDQDPDKAFLVPPDPARSFVSKRSYKQIFTSGSEPNGHGFALIDPATESASRGAAGYYSFRPEGVDGLRMIALDSVAEGGALLTSAQGNLDDPQVRWLKKELSRAQRRGELAILFSHHAPASMGAAFADEDAPPCTAVEPEASPPGCDLDPRDSRPIHVRDGCPAGSGPDTCVEDIPSLLDRFPNVIAWVAGHSHVNRVEPHVREGGRGFWMVRVAAEADWPQQSRLLELFDNRDGTLSLFGTVLDHASPSAAAPSETPAGELDPAELASIGRTLSYNDPQSGAAACSPTPCGEGGAGDRNVELLIEDPRGLRIGVKPKHQRVGVGRTARISTPLTNDRSVPVDAVRVCLEGAPKVLRGRHCEDVGTIGVGDPADAEGTAVARFKLTPARQAAGRRFKLRFTVTGEGVDPQSATSRLRVKQA